MCGLFAGLGKLNTNRIIALGSMNEERGTDSVGIAYLNNGVMAIEKVAERPITGLNITLRKAVTEAAVSGLFIGHTRQATQGEVTSRNAHPFLTDGIAFAHNGIIFNDDEFGKYAVDSESLIHGIKEKDFSKYDGPIALVWIENGKLHAFRHGNPLYRGRHHGGIYLASDKDHLKSVGCTSIKELSEGLIYTFHSPSNITTERVGKNTVYSSYTPAKATTYDTGVSWKDYLNDHQPSQFKLDHPISADGIKEDFRTERDIARQSASQDYCDICGQLGELTEGYCLECISWMDQNGVMDKDLPSIQKGF